MAVVPDSGPVVGQDHFELIVVVQELFGVVNIGAECFESEGVRVELSLIFSPRELKECRVSLLFARVGVIFAQFLRKI